MNAEKLPRAEEDLLVRAAVAPREEALDSWKRWKAQYLSTAHERLETRFTPEIYRRLLDWGIEDETLPLLQKARQTTWLRNTALHQAALPILRTIHQHNIPLFFLKGSALMCGHFDDLGYRYMRDVDLFVPFEYASQTYSLFTEAQWSPIEEYREPLFATEHGISFANSDNAIIDFHWHITYYLKSSEFDTRLLASHTMHTFCAIPYGLLAPSEQLFHVLVHGQFRQGNCYWAMDSKRLIEQYSSTISWKTIGQLARTAKVLSKVQNALSVLENYDSRLVDKCALSDIANVPLSKLEKLEQYNDTHPQLGLTGGLRFRIATYLRSGFPHQSRSHILGFLWYLRSHWRNPSWGETMILALRKVIRFPFRIFRA